jgi:uncharacterized protein
MDLLTLMITSMIFFPDKTFYEKPEGYGFKYEEVRISSAEGVSLFGWFLFPKTEPSKGAVLFLHGNAGNISGRLYKAKGWTERGYSVLLIDYRSYGKSTGEIRRGEDIVEDSIASFDWLIKTKKVPPSQIIVYGESLGSHPAIRLGTLYKLASVILEAPFTSFYDLGKLHYPFVPEQLIKDFEFSNIQWIEKLKSPLFILHGTQDEICPYAMAGELFDRAPEPKGFLSIPNGTHNDLPAIAGEDYWQKPVEFVETVRLDARSK